MNAPLIVISGASKGIGRAIADRFWQEGFQVVGCARSIANIDLPKERFELWACDVADKTEIKAFAQQVLTRYGTPDVLVNNAGRYVPGNFFTEADGILEDMLATNLHSAYHLTRAFLQPMADRKKGTIFNIGSTASFMPYVNGGSYCISKYGLLGLTEVLREELKPHNIRVTAVLPGATYTDSWAESGVEPERLMSSEDVAETIWTTYTLSSRTVVEKIILRPQLGDLG